MKSLVTLIALPVAVVLLIAVSLVTVASLADETANPANATPAKADVKTPPTGVWTIAEGLAEPESAYYDSESKLLFISNVAGSPSEKDGRGWITKADAKGKVLSANWIKDLNAPKGLRSHKGMLWFSDIDRVIAIDIKTAAIKQTVEVKGSKFLNDVAIDNDGVVYVSDMFDNVIYKIADGKASIVAEGEMLGHPNGLLVHEEHLIVAGWGSLDAKTPSEKSGGHLYSIDLATKKIEHLTRKPLGNLDGLELDGNGGYFVSDWVAGRVYRVSSEGEATMFLEGFKGSADLGIIDAAGLLIVPRMGENKVTAYKIND